jgi:hypothetical protein
MVGLQAHDAWTSKGRKRAKIDKSNVYGIKLDQHRLAPLAHLGERTPEVYNLASVRCPVRAREGAFLFAF